MRPPRELVETWSNEPEWLSALPELVERARGWGVAHNLAWAWDERLGWSEHHVEEARRILTAR